MWEAQTTGFPDIHRKRKYPQIKQPWETTIKAWILLLDMA